MTKTTKKAIRALGGSARSVKPRATASAAGAGSRPFWIKAHGQAMSVAAAKSALAACLEEYVLSETLRRSHPVRWRLQVK